MCPKLNMCKNKKVLQQSLIMTIYKVKKTFKFLKAKYKCYAWLKTFAQYCLHSKTTKYHLFKAIQ